MDNRPLYEVLDALEDEAKVKLSAIARGAVSFLSPYSKTEQAALNLYYDGALEDLSAAVRNQLWQEFDSLHGKERSRKRLFINLLAGEKRIADGDCSGMAESMAQAGISNADIEKIFRAISS